MRAAQLDPAVLARTSDRLGETVLDPGQWPDVIESLCRATVSTGAALLQGDVRTADIPRSVSADELIAAYFKNNWANHDIWAERSVPLLLGGASVVADQDIVSPDEMRRLPFYNEHIYRHGFEWYAAVGFRAGSALWGLCLYRTSCDGPFEKSERRALASLSHKLSEVATLSTAVGRRALAGATNALNAVRLPALAIDRCGRVLDFNASAQALFDGGLRVHNGRLVLSDRNASAELDTLFARLRTVPDTDAVPALPIIVRRRQRPAVVINMLPVEAAARGPFLGARAILTLKEAAPKTSPSIPTMMRLFGLTPAEARLAGLLVEGQSVSEIAEGLKLSRETLRNQLKVVFAKTGARRQGELIAMFSQF
jgi:DNA-binding CsgD family transcriptional regulator